MDRSMAMVAGVPFLLASTAAFGMGAPQAGAESHPAPSAAQSDGGRQALLDMSLEELSASKVTSVTARGFSSFDNVQMLVMVNIISRSHDGLRAPYANLDLRLPRRVFVEARVRL